MLDNAAVFLVHTGQKAWNIHEGHQGDIEAIAHPHELSTFQGSLDVKTPCQKPRLVGHNTDDHPIKPAESDETPQLWFPAPVVI